MSESNHITIPKKVETKDDLDYDFLRKEGINYIEQLGSKLWTDYNSHDPGITILEVLSYAITDLGMRTNLDMEDILASDVEGKELHTQFIKATEILPSAPLTSLDYRKLFIDIGESLDLDRPIKNCWLVPYEETIYTDCKTGNLSYEADEEGFSNVVKEFGVKGLYKLIIDIDDDIVGDCDITAINRAILDRFNENRNLCEDLVAIEEITTQDVAICAKIEVERDVDEEKVHAQVLYEIEQYFAPEVNFYSLTQLLDKGYTTDEIFEGPVLDNGFIDNDELEKSQLRSELRLSDIVSIIMSVEGVKKINEISMNRCDGSSSSDTWVLSLDEGVKPILCDLKSFSYSKGTLPLNINETKVDEYKQEIEAAAALAIDTVQEDLELPFPEGTSYDMGAYTSILNEFPDTYGVGSYGIISQATPERKALAKQLKGYLLFFDKILASYFKHLSKVKDILSVSGSETQTYFTQAIEGFDGLMSDVYEKNKKDENLSNLLFEEIDNNAERRNEVLDHLLGRFAENFNDYVFVMKELYGNSVDEIVLKNKEAFLADYKVIGPTRGLGYNYNLNEEHLWNTNNVSGVQKRIARLLGIKNYDRRNISNSPVNIIAKKDTTDDTFYSWEIENKEGIRLLYSDDQFQIEHVAFTKLYTAVYNFIQIDAEEVGNVFEEDIVDGQLIGYIKISVTDKGEYSFSIVDNLEELNEIAFLDEANFKYNSKNEFQKGLEDILEYLKNDFTEEGIFLIENILLKPTNKTFNVYDNGGIGCMDVESNFSESIFTVGKPDINVDEIPEIPIDNEAFIKDCDGECDDELLDPYSYRVTIILPGYSYRFSDPDFRKYAEQVIREELPAHVLAKICWVGDRNSETEAAVNNLVNFETSYEQFLKDKSFGTIQDVFKSTKDLIEDMNNLYNIYRPGRLLDCNDEDETLDGRIILGQSNI